MSIARDALGGACTQHPFTLAPVLEKSRSSRGVADTLRREAKVFFLGRVRTLDATCGLTLRLELLDYVFRRFIEIVQRILTTVLECCIDQRLVVKPATKFSIVLKVVSGQIA